MKKLLLAIVLIVGCDDSSPTTLETVEPPEPELESDDWEMATEDELKSGEFEAS